MVKVKSPLSSPSATGTLNDVLTFFNRSGFSFARFKTKNPVSSSTSQLAVRTLFKEASVLAKQLTNEEKDFYASLDPNSAACPWWNNFIADYILKGGVPVGVTISSLQSGVLSFGPNTFAGFTITSVDLNKAVIFNMGDVPGGSVVDSCYSTAWLTLPYYVYATRYGSSHSLLTGFMVIEFDGLLRPVQHKVVHFIADAYESISIDSVDVSKSFIIPMGLNTDTDNFAVTKVRFAFVDSTHVGCWHTIPVDSVLIHFDVVEFP